MEKNKRMLDVSASEFRRSRNRQEQQAKSVTDNNTKRMLLFYAGECGGKYELMIREGCRLFSHLPEKYKKYKHDINAILKEIGITKCEFPSVYSVYDEQINAGQYQEMWRYGINCQEADEKGKIIEQNLLEALSLLHDMDRRK